MRALLTILMQEIGRENDNAQLHFITRSRWYRGGTETKRSRLQKKLPRHLSFDCWCKNGCASLLAELRHRVMPLLWGPSVLCFSAKSCLVYDISSTEYDKPASYRPHDVFLAFVYCSVAGKRFVTPGLAGTNFSSEDTRFLNEGCFSAAHLTCHMSLFPMRFCTSVKTPHFSRTCGVYWITTLFPTTASVQSVWLPGSRPLKYVMRKLCLRNKYLMRHQRVGMSNLLPNKGHRAEFKANNGMWGRLYILLAALRKRLGRRPEGLSNRVPSEFVFKSRDIRTYLGHT